MGARQSYYVVARQNIVGARQYICSWREGKKGVGDGSYRGNSCSAEKVILEFCDKNVTYEKAPRGMPWCAIVEIYVAVLLDISPQICSWFVGLLTPHRALRSLLSPGWERQLHVPVLLTALRAAPRANEEQRGAL